MLTFQDAIFALQKFWASEGCLIWEPYYLQLGAGTMNPATFLRVLGPEPWRVAYVEPSVRPDDARFGENPNRMGLHYQYQVILKPDPGNPQELYLKSLDALGIDLARHDIRFVEDNWEQPALGAWGLGWEVWLDGLEISQFTYFQQAGGQSLDPVSVELTYGLERILMAIQGVRHFGDIQWDERRTYGDINLASEEQHSRYYFEIADVELLREMFNGYEAEANRSLEAGLTLPAYDSLLRCSHTFNVLDTRGAVGVTERAAYFGRMRSIARKVAESYLQERETAGHPWLERDVDQEPDVRAGSGMGPKQPEFFVLEIGTEELPAEDLSSALAQMEESLETLLADARLEHGKVRIMGTPRRLIAAVEGLAPHQSASERKVKGPPWSKAFDADGNPTEAALGFAASSGVEVSELLEEKMDGGSYAVAVARDDGGPAWQPLSEKLPDLIAGIQFDKAMRWDQMGTTFSRPIRWLLALHGESVVPFRYGELLSGRSTRPLRGSQDSDISVPSAAKYFETLDLNGIIPDVATRRSEVVRQIEAAAKEASGSVELDERLLGEVTNLVEAPRALLGSFDKAYLDLPRDVLAGVMKKHQRYFPVEANGNLLANFVVIANGERESYADVVAGNEDVIRARFADAKYFVARDLEQPLENYVEQLDKLTFQTDLGSMLDKTHRLEGLTASLAGQLELSEGEGQSAVRAAQLCKADLATLMVVDMTSLQGAMGRYYATQSGESEIVAEAIFEHYLPRFAGDELPSTAPGAILAIADRLDTLMGLFSVGAQPTGTRDPFGLRRSAVGLVQITVARQFDLDLRPALGWAWDGFEKSGDSDALESCLEFIVRRQQQLLLDLGRPYDVVAAVLAAQGATPTAAYHAVDELTTQVEQPGWLTILQAYSRCGRITRDFDRVFEFEEGRIEEEPTRVLYRSLQTAEGASRRPGSVNDFVAAFEPMIAAIDRFFEEVMVMADEQALRKNRLGLLQRIVKLADGVADFSQLEGY